jgi:hypothetical protein
MLDTSTSLIKKIRRLWDVQVLVYIDHSAIRDQLWRVTSLCLNQPVRRALFLRADAPILHAACSSIIIWSERVTSRLKQKRGRQKIYVELNRKYSFLSRRATFLRYETSTLLYFTCYCVLHCTAVSAITECNPSSTYTSDSLQYFTKTWDIL